MKEILLCTDGSSFAENVYQYGAWLALRCDAHINVLSVTDIRSQKIAYTGNLSGSIGLGASEKLLNELVNLEYERAKLNNQKARLILQNAEEILTAEGVKDFDLIHRTGFLVDCFQEFEQSSDVIVLGKRGENADFAPEHLGANIERLVRSSHKPCLVIPRNYHPIDKILLAYDGGKSCQKALDFIVASEAFKGLELHLLTIAKKHDTVTAQKILNSGAIKAREGGFEPICEMLDGDAEDLISGYIDNNKINFLIMGAYGHNRIRHLVIGSTTAQMLRRCEIPVLLFR